MDGKIIERIQYLFMRVALGIHGDNIKDAVKTYDALSEQYFIHATPTLFNAGTPRSQLSSCYLLSMKDDSISGIYETLSDCAKISKWAGGIGTDWSNIRATGSKIKGTNGMSQGVVPFLKIFNDVALAVNQGGKRKGAMCAYMELWHLDIDQFLELKTTTKTKTQQKHKKQTKTKD